MPPMTKHIPTREQAILPILDLVRLISFLITFVITIRTITEMNISPNIANVVPNVYSIDAPTFSVSKADASLTPNKQGVKTR